MGKKKGGRGQKKGGMPGVSKGIKKALKNMPKVRAPAVREANNQARRCCHSDLNPFAAGQAERQMVAEGLSVIPIPALRGPIFVDLPA
jgi:hypothetical protein